MKAGTLVGFNGVAHISSADWVPQLTALLLDDHCIDGSGALMVDIMESETIDDDVWVTQSAINMLTKYVARKNRGCEDLPNIWEAITARWALLPGEGRIQRIVFMRSERCKKLGVQRHGLDIQKSS